MPNTSQYSQAPKKPFHEKIGYSETKSSRRKAVIHSLMQKAFRYQKLSKTQKGSRTKCFGTVRQNNCTKNRGTPISHSFLAPKTFRNTKRAPSRTFTGRQKFPTSFCDNPAMLHQIFCTHQMDSARNFRKTKYFQNYKKGPLPN